MVREVEPKAAAAYAAKTRAELDEADALLRLPAGTAWSGSLSPAVALIKGEPGPAELGGGPALSGPDGEAAEKALDALGVTGARWCTLSRPAPEIESAAAVERLRLQLIAVDPAAVVALDPVAALDVAAALGVPVPEAGVPTAALGMTLLLVDGLEASLGDEKRKREVWGQFKGLLGETRHPQSDRDARRRPDDRVLF